MSINLQVMRQDDRESQNDHVVRRVLPKYIDLDSRIADLSRLSEKTKIVLAAGMRRSGSTWLYHATRLVMELGGGRTCARFIEDLQVGEAATADVVILKVHQPDEALAFRAWRIFTSHRDLRDVARSALDMGIVKDFDTLAAFLKQCIAEHSFWTHRAQMDLRYEDLLAGDTLAVIRSIAAVVEIPLTSEQIRSVGKKVDAIKEPYHPPYENETHLHPRHRLDSRWGSWIEKLDAATTGKIEAKFENWLERHYYPVSKVKAPSPASFIRYREQRANLNTTCNDSPQMMQPANPRLESLERRLIVVVDADLASQPYRCFSYISDLIHQIESASTIDIVFLGKYKGPKLKKDNVRLLRIGRSSRHISRLVREFKPAKNFNWFSSLDEASGFLFEILMGQADYTDLIVFTSDPLVASFTVRSLLVMAQGALRRACVALPSSCSLDHRQVRELTDFGARIVIDASNFDEPSFNWADTGLLFHMDDPRETPLRPRKAPQIDWRYQLSASRLPQSPLETVLFVRPDWMKCGSATTFNTLTRGFRTRRAIIVDVALQSRNKPYKADEIRQKIRDVQNEFSPWIHVNFQRGPRGGRFLKPLLYYIRYKPHTIAGFMPFYYLRCALQRKVIAQLRKIPFSYAYVNHYFTLPAAKEIRPDIKVLLDTHDLQSINFVDHEYRWVRRGRLASFTACLKEEMDIVQRADVVTMVSQDELDIMLEAVPALDSFVYIPIPRIEQTVPEMPLRHNLRVRERPVKLLIVASRNPANERSLGWFLDNVWPLAVATGARLEIVGSIDSSFAGKKYAGITFTGVVDDLAALYRAADIVLLPITNGGGIAIKTLEALLFEKPLVATRHALRGLPEDVRRCMSATNDERVFANDLLTLIANPEARRTRALEAALARELLIHYDFDSELHRQLDRVARSDGQRASAASTGSLSNSEIHRTLFRFFEQGIRTQDLVIPASDVEPDGRPEWIPDMLARRELHEPDFIIFKRFDDPAETIIDVGANYGYSVISIWAAGSKASVLSFEPIAVHEQCLRLIRERFPERYDFRMVGLGNETGEAGFAMPVIGHTGISALTTADDHPDLGGLARNIQNHIEQHYSGPKTARLKLCEFRARIQTLDHLLAAGGFTVPTDRIAALKIDTEGYERQVIEGAVKTLKTHRPLVMVEGANRDPSLQQIMNRLGYRFACRDGDQLIPMNGLSFETNGFFFHESRLEEYRSRGLVLSSVQPTIETGDVL
jgi:FkbM family methyltransferase